MAHKFFVIFLIYMTVSVVVESNSKFNVKNDKISEFNIKDLKQLSREKRQNNYIYYGPYPLNGFQSYYVVNNQRPGQRPDQSQNQIPSQPPSYRPTRHPQRKSTTQRYSIWDLARKRRSTE